MHEVAPGRRADEHRPAAVLLAAGGGTGGPLGRLEQRHEDVAVGGEQEVAADHRVQQGVLAGQLAGRGRGWRPSTVRRTASPSGTHRTCSDAGQRLGAVAAGDGDRDDRLAGLDGTSTSRSTATASSHPSSRRCRCRKRSRTWTTAARRPRRAPSPSSSAPRPARRRPTGSGSGSWPPSAGTGRARSPPTARRRRWRRPGRRRPRSPPARSLRRSAERARRSVASQSVKPIRVLYACRASSVSVRTRIQPPPGQYRSTVLRHVATGSGNVHSLCHGIWVTA